VIVVVIRIPVSTEENASLSKKWTKDSLSAPVHNILRATSVKMVILHVFFIPFLNFIPFFISGQMQENSM